MICLANQAVSLLAVAQNDIKTIIHQKRVILPPLLKLGNCFDHSERTPDERVVGLFCWASRSEKRSSGWQEGSENGVIEAFHIMSLRANDSERSNLLLNGINLFCEISRINRD